MKKVSVVIPAYNSHDTLAKCLGSLVNQTLQDIEIVVVNDASTDDTLEIMNRCKAQFPDKVVVVDSKVNLGPGGARNLGFDAATGEYIGLVDSDDYVAPTMYEKLYIRAKETDADIVDSGFYREATDKAQLFASDDMTGILDDEKRSKLISSGGYLVTKIFKSELFNKPKVRMQSNMVVLEDFVILIYMYLRALRLETIKEIFYCYCDTPGSNTKTMDTDKYYDSVYRAMKSTYDICHKLPTYEGCRQSIEYMLLNIYSYGINRCLYDNIARLGADSRLVRKYFKDIPPKEKEMMRSLCELKNVIIRIPYDENEIVKKKIAKLDIDIMKECDKWFEGK